jgi:uncharacterized protein (DUF1330 family)
MPKAYFVACYRQIRDPEALAAYAKLGGPAIEASGGRVLARGGRVHSLEGGIDLRTVVVEFDDLDSALAFYHSEAYREARQVLGDGAVRDIRVVEGVE